MKKRSKFSLSHYKLATMDMGELVPVSCIEALPGDTIQMQTSAFVRVAPTLAPVMTPCHVNFMTFSVPLRLLWDNGPEDDWENFITGGPDGLNAAVPPFYTIPSGTTISTGSLSDYLGLPAGEAYGAELQVSALPFRAYWMIYNEYFRDQDLQSEIEFDLTGGDQGDLGTWDVEHVDWKKDYFTVARPWEQKGPAVTIPLGTSAPVNFYDESGDTFNALGYTMVSSDRTGIPVEVGTGWSINLSNSGTLGHAYKMNADLSQASAITVDNLRQAFALQRFEEARALFGSRYVEYLRYLGVRSSDARLQRPEYLGGGSQVIQWSEVVQTAEGSQPVGTLRGHGVSGGRTRRFRRFFEEHSLVMTLAFIRPVALYTQALNKMWSRTLKEDYWQRELQHIGQQEVENKEVYALGESPEGVFGYMDRYDEYRSAQNTICGDFRTSLDYWHLGRVFSSQPVLNSDFVSCNPSKRIFAEQTADEFYCMFLHSVQARRLVSRKGRPGGL